MGKLIAADIPNLISGVSQQPWNVRLPTQAEEQVNCYSSVTDFLRRRPATKHIAKLRDTKFTNGCAEHHINRDEQEKYTCLFTSSSIEVFDLQGQKKTVNASVEAMAYLSTVVNPETDLRFLTINDYTFVLNRKKVVEQSSDLSPKRVAEALVFIKQASYNTTYYVTLDGKTVSFTTLDGVAPSDQPADKLSSKEIAESLASQLTTADYSIQSQNNTIWIRKKDGSDFVIKAEDTRSNTHISVFKNKVQRFSDLPTVAPKGFTVEIYGDSSSSFDNYYCQFEPTDSNDTFGAGLWKETVKPGIPFKLDAATMPHALVRNADGTFEFKALDWTERTCGDEDSAAMPSFVGRTINSVFFYRNRLAFLSEENVIMSEVGEFFNFFPTTVTTMVDSDRIDVAASHVRSNTIQKNFSHVALGDKVLDIMGLPRKAEHSATHKPPSLTDGLPIAEIITWVGLKKYFSEHNEPVVYFSTHFSSKENTILPEGSVWVCPEYAKIADKNIINFDWHIATDWTKLKNRIPHCRVALFLDGACCDIQVRNGLKQCDFEQILFHDYGNLYLMPTVHPSLIRRMWMLARASLKQRA